MHMGSAFALKAVINGHYAVQFIASMWLGTMFVLAYWFRGVENTACLFWNETIHEGCHDRSARFWSLNGGAEFPKLNDLYIQNAAWAMFVTSTTVGFGAFNPLPSQPNILFEGIAARLCCPLTRNVVSVCVCRAGDIVPTTHLGRSIAAVMAILGISMIALLTASLANALQYTPAELSAILVMEREQARQRVLQQAAGNGSARQVEKRDES
eukprot:3021280-Rhodomonas_salina.2